ncbi:hypothetical protein RHSIM_Rhsim01G0060500 [Rhododendron simsii]|uniref:Uncharacterized protein n=1 Tax=Rhododendron simsii TaxID=118357 RepID=A0A834HGY5_RHOSS|nr:hypothetical protein RHSIM_Rhsim01G0060500 [Rhododendron simsii]
MVVVGVVFGIEEKTGVGKEAFNLIEGIDVPANEGKIAQYHKESAEQIMNAQQFKKYIYNECSSPQAFNLIEGIDVPAIDGKIAQYHKKMLNK